MKKIILIFGTRPEAIKMCPLVLELKKSKCFETKVIVTGQHAELLESVLQIFKVVPDYNLRIMQPNQSLFQITSNILLQINEILERERPWLVLVHGDTTTTFSAALSAFYGDIKIGHVEAGLRSGSIKEPFPEEFNRRTVSLISDFDFCPTQLAFNNLIKEGKNPDNILITGNTGIDALKYTVSENFESEVTRWVGDSKLILLTAHRRENLPYLTEMLRAIRDAVHSFPNFKIVYPAHPNPIVQKAAHEIFDKDPNAKIIPPVDVVTFHNLISKSYLILTDSGGIQEEAPHFGVPVLVLRNVTERPEGIAAGTLKLIGNEPKKIYKEIINILNDKQLYNQMSKAANPYGDGNACPRIVKFLEKKSAQ